MTSVSVMTWNQSNKLKPFCNQKFWIKKNYNYKNKIIIDLIQYSIMYRFEKNSFVVFV